MPLAARRRLKIALVAGLVTGSIPAGGAPAGTRPAPAAGTVPAELTIELERLRNRKGMIHACLTRSEAHFPDCAGDADAVRLSVPAAKAALRFQGLPRGTWALSIVHDENGNGKLDKFAAIPREGFGFSGNPPIRFGPPRFDEARFEMTPGPNRQQVRIRYLL